MTALTTTQAERAWPPQAGAGVQTNYGRAIDAEELEGSLVRVLRGVLAPEHDAAAEALRLILRTVREAAGNAQQLAARGELTAAARAEILQDLWAAILEPTSPPRAEVAEP